MPTQSRLNVLGSGMGVLEKLMASSNNCCRVPVGPRVTEKSSSPDWPAYTPWQEHPATEKQLAYLQCFGFVPGGPINKGEASASLVDLKMTLNAFACEARLKKRRQ